MHLYDSSGETPKLSQKLCTSLSIICPVDTARPVNEAQQLALCNIQAFSPEEP